MDLRARLMEPSGLNTLLAAAFGMDRAALGLAPSSAVPAAAVADVAMAPMDVDGAPGSAASASGWPLLKPLAGPLTLEGIKAARERVRASRGEGS